MPFYIEMTWLKCEALRSAASGRASVGRLAGLL
jgi:hypothetical protein